MPAGGFGKTAEEGAEAMVEGRGGLGGVHCDGVGVRAPKVMLWGGGVSKDENELRC